ncbi:alpha/beta-hydrolase [Marasmius fiardii PR-910]|nr:alpha/beta-hydrolase [Marasmius fiardii PR-910]
MAYYPYRRQPIKGLYLIYQFFTTVFIRFPVWILLAIPRPLRPRKSWDLRRAVVVNFARHMIAVTSHTGPLVKTPTHLAVAPVREDAGHVPGIWISPASSSYIIGSLEHWAKVAKVSGVRIPGYWQHKKGSTIKPGASPMPGEKVVLALHGGAYIRLSAHPSDATANIARGLLQACDNVIRVLSPEYRLSSTKPWAEVNPFPAALLDALAAYQYLVEEVGFSTEDIIIEGDSAGGNLAHALTRYLVEHQEAIKPLAPPSALILLSPWVDINHTHHGQDSSLVRNLRSDYLGISAERNHSSGYAGLAFLGPHGLGFAEKNPYISPASLNLRDEDVSFYGFPRTFIIAGGAEVLYDQIHTLKERMVKSLGEDKVRWYVAEDGVHDYIALPIHEPERTETLKAVAEWLA